MKHKIPLVNRDLSWLSFNGRVLQEAEDTTVPLLERLRFLGIFSNNRDEFFRVRVATIRRMQKWGKKGKELLGTDPEKLLEKIQHVVLEQQKKFDKLFNQLLKELGKEKLHLVNEKEIPVQHRTFVRNYFEEKVFPFLVPIMIESAPKFPYLKDKTMYLAVRIVRKNKEGNKKIYSLIEVPTDVLPRFLVLPSEGEQKYILLLEDIIRFSLDKIFSIFEHDSIEAYVIKMTRDAELDIEADFSKSLVEKISRSVKQRNKGEPVRLVYDEKIPDELLRFIIKKIKLKETEAIIPGGRYHNFRDFINFPRVGRKELRYKNPAPVEHPDLIGQPSVFAVLKKKDILLAYPYHSFNHVIDLLREASIDPKVTGIKITLYRAAENSSVINALINAIRNGKQVTVVVELQARFDEETNMFYANKLQEEGAEVIYGVPGLKVHSKLFIIQRKDDGRPVNYVHIGTGNFNELTARIYADHSLLTADKGITREVDRLFNFYKNNYKTGHYKHLLVSPFNTRKKFSVMIEREIQNAKAKKPAWMILKMNSLVDNDLIERLYEASSAGVKIKLIIRGICALVPGVKGMSENIEAISIVDRFLEHSRIYIFSNGGDPKYYIASGDWMNRNLDFRSEVATPIYDKNLQTELRNYVHLQMQDNCKARYLNSSEDNKYVKRPGKRIRAQEEIFNVFNPAKKNTVKIQAAIEPRSNGKIVSKRLVKA